jgi:hypothetical protein
MGYISDVSGEIYINEDVKVKHLQNLITSKLAKTLAGKMPLDHCVFVDYEQNFEEVEDFTIVRFTASEIKPTDSSMKAYGIVAEVQKIVDILGDGYTYSGYIELNGEEPGDLWRIYIRQGKAVEVQPKIVWPEE